MSKDRARRRAAREAQAERDRAERTRRQQRIQLRSRVWRAVAGPLTRPFQRRRPATALGRQRAQQNSALLGGLAVANGLLWLNHVSIWIQLIALVASVLLWPVLVVLIFDRRHL